MRLSGLPEACRRADGCCFVREVLHSMTRRASLTGMSADYSHGNLI